MDERVKEIALHYGLKSQMDKAIEESAELTAALIARKEVLTSYEDGSPQYIRALKDTWNHIAEEIADCRIMCDQIEFLLGMKVECETQREFKIRRQLCRMAKGE